MLLRHNSSFYLSNGAFINISNQRTAPSKWPCFTRAASNQPVSILLVYETKQTQPVQMTLHFVSSPGGDVIPFTTSAYAFCNPCNETFEFIVCTHTSQNYSEPKPSQQLSQVPTAMGNSPHMDPTAGTAAQSYYGMHNLQQQQYPTSGYHTQEQSALNSYQSQFMTDNGQFGQGSLVGAHMGNAVSGRSQINQQPNGAAASYGNYLIMPSK